MKYKYYDVCLIKDEKEWFYNVKTTLKVQELVDWAIKHNQEIKYIRGRVR